MEQISRSTPAITRQHFIGINSDRQPDVSGLQVSGLLMLSKVSQFISNNPPYSAS
ncbi:MAG: hypothetical protein PHF56_11840 [Desulfuromonadaceae bacterium]|nr:hypothetical protein [Desulfuromonadaceae bacterium]